MQDFGEKRKKREGRERKKIDLVRHDFSGEAFRLSTIGAIISM